MKDDHKYFDKYAPSPGSRPSDPGGRVKPNDGVAPSAPKDTPISARSKVVGTNAFMPWNHTKAGEAMNTPTGRAIRGK